AAVIAANLDAARLAGPNATVVRADALGWLGRSDPGGPPFDLVFVDPPYADVELLRAVLASLGGAGAPLAPDARVVAKHFWRDRPPERIGMLALERDRRFGESALTFYRREESTAE
ncbi:MAG TPA: RsmD family RNA methyltransferase, partial [Candidatus Limnocylindrales bacterium]|nr:RsmD family RNA methyltransferase [Candidatus Limnocylindrales bacterium]